MVATLLASGVGQPDQIVKTALFPGGGGFLLIIDGVPNDKLQRYAIVNVATNLVDTGVTPVLFESWSCWLPFTYVGFGQGNTPLQFFIKFFKRDTSWALYRIT